MSGDSNLKCVVAQKRNTQRVSTTGVAIITEISIRCCVNIVDLILNFTICIDLSDLFGELNAASIALAY